MSCLAASTPLCVVSVRVYVYVAVRHPSYVGTYTVVCLISSSYISLSYYVLPYVH